MGFRDFFFSGKAFGKNHWKISQFPSLGGGIFVIKKNYSYKNFPIGKNEGKM